MIPLPLFEPDKSPFLFRAGDNLANCLPKADGWGPMLGWVPVSEALPDVCLGAIFIKDADNSITIIAGTRTNLYRLNQAATPYTWDVVSKSADAYNVPDGDRWSFTKFGDFLIAHNLGGATQVIDLTGAGNFADLPDAPVAKHSWIAGDFLVMGWLDGQPNAIQWSGVNDHTFWTVGRRGADIQTFPDGDGIAGGIGDQQGALIMFRQKIRRMQFAPASGYTFTMSDVNPYRGTIAPYSVVPVGTGDFFYLCDDGFYRGAQGVPIGTERVNRWFLNDQVDLDFIYDVRGVADPFNTVVWWRYQKIDGTGALLGYNWQLDRWLYSTVDVQHAVAMATPGVTIDGLGELFGAIDDIVGPFDSRAFAGGTPVFAAFDADGKLSFATGATLPATIRTAQLELTQNSRTFVSGFRVETDATNMTARIGKADTHGDPIAFRSSLSPSTRGKMFRDRVSGRLHQFEVSIPAAHDWSIITNIRVDATPEGML